MEKRFYVVSVITNSNGTESRNITPYTNEETALRKFYEPLGNIGGGPTKICVLLLDAYFTQIKKEVWEHVEPDVITEPLVES